MEVTVEGIVKVRVTTGWGPFERKKWTSSKFSWRAQVPLEETEQPYHEVATGLELSVERHDSRAVVLARLRRQALILGDCQLDEDRNFPFSVLSISGAEINGRIVFRPMARLRPSNPTPGRKIAV